MTFELTTYDKSLLKRATLKIFDTKKTFKFQFPPRVTSEEKGSTWDSKDIVSHAPLKIYKGATARSLTLEAEFIAGLTKDWLGVIIAQNIRDLREYYQKAKLAFGKKSTYAVVQLKLYEIVPQEANFRLMNVSVEYGHELVNATGIWPLYTKVSMSLELATQLDKPKFGEDIGDRGKQLLKAAPLKPMEAPWY